MPTEQLEKPQAPQARHSYPARLQMDLHQRVKMFAREWSMSYNSALNVLLKEALDARER